MTDTKQMPTLRELVETISPYKNTDVSVSYSHSRTVLSLFDKPVIAYAYGWNMLVVVVKNRSKVLMGYGYTHPYYFSGYHQGGTFSEIPVERALALIKDSMVIKRNIDTEGFKNAYEQKVLAKFKIIMHTQYQAGGSIYTEEREYKVVELKNGLIGAMWKMHYYPRFKRSRLDDLLSAYTAQPNGSLIKVEIQGEIPTEIIQRIKSQILVKQI